MLSALMVMAYDVVEDEEMPAQEREDVLELVLPEIEQRFEWVEEARREHMVMSYLCRSVYPLLDCDVDLL
jgi:hypothetical protein